MESFSTNFAIVVLMVFVHSISADSEYMLSKPETITTPYNYETKLTCEMNIEADKFLWKFYRSKNPYNSKANISLSDPAFQEIQSENNSKQRRKSSLSIRVKEENAGEYQCLAFYGAYVVASVPWRINLAIMKDFPYQRNINITILEGNTVAWICQPPESNPEAYIDYYKDGSITSLQSKTQNKVLIQSNVSLQDSGVYKCNATNTATSPVQMFYSRAVLNLKVVKSAPSQAPYFIMQPKKSYIVVKGSSAFLECSAVGTPVPKVAWFKKNSLLPKNRTEMVPGGLIIHNVTSTDDGTYVCNHTNNQGTISHHITLIYNEEPSVDCYPNNTDVTQGQTLDLYCLIKGVPEPQITWFLNGYSVNNDKAIEAVGNRIYFQPVEKRHAGNVQCFARNSVGTVYDSISLRVIPLSSSIDDISYPTTHSHRRNNGKTVGTRKPSKYGKLPKMVPPSKPLIARLNDESVVVRWNVPSNNGLPIQFFKVQYRELGPINGNEHKGKGSKWKTTNEDIAPNIKDFDVTNLKPDHIYRFRVAAVYSNNDNKLSPNSDKFFLRRLDFDYRNPLAVPIISNAQPVNDTAIIIYWKYTPAANTTIDGFYLSYISASTAGDYTKATADGENTRSYIITHLAADTVYDVKIQSFTSKFASEFSTVWQVKTNASLNLPGTTTMAPLLPTPKGETSSFSKLYIIILVVVIVLSIIIGGFVLLCVCRWQKSKNDDRDKSVVEDHHIPADGGDYVGSKTQPRTNGCVPNRMTITANPLADADNKKFLARIFSRTKIT